MILNIMKLLKVFESTVLSHELDHLDGILHIDIALELLVIDKEEQKNFAKQMDIILFQKLEIIKNY